MTYSHATNLAEIKAILELTRFVDDDVHIIEQLEEVINLELDNSSGGTAMSDERVRAAICDWRDREGEPVLGRSQGLRGNSPLSVQQVVEYALEQGKTIREAFRNKNFVQYSCAEAVVRYDIANGLTIGFEFSSRDWC